MSRAVKQKRRIGHFKTPYLMKRKVRGGAEKISRVKTLIREFGK
jgi:hypothetical protein